ncbi:penicillin-binding protein 2 [Endozoicomonas sp. OPT23]|uniref:penicillin-binding protein 2 n=1 Tax=Endozoicomonas sp. OPT23 TaxID=2072845 RepID=UPI00129BF49B|nr:penicillin-binding protein 2 [Endozoicomonas sp. OPT23]MRI33581.1 penicillin-binding protein 2 [Endozoicomonas sp. OPT23]
MPVNTLKDHKSEQRIVSIRVWLALVFILLLAMVLVSRLFYLQVIKYDELSTRSEENRILVQTVPPVRGLIYDRNGNLLATNRSSKTLSIVRERVDDMDQLLSDIGNLVPLSDNEQTRFKKQVRRRRPFEAVPLKFKLNDEQVALISVNQFRLPGVEVNAELVREYTEGSSFAHSVGYVGRINDRELKKLDPALYSGTYTIGKIGLERFYEKLLLGKPGYQEVEVNVRGRVSRVLKRVDPVPGQDLHLYIDTGLQDAAIKAMDGRRGSVAVLDPKTGGVMAMVSNPAFDPNLFVTGIAYSTFDDLNTDIERPLYNRATLGEYPPASTVKPVVALGLLSSGTVKAEDKIFDKGWFQLPGSEHKFRNWKRGGDGWINLDKAIYRSNDTYFYNFAGKYGIDRMHDFLSEFGYGRKTGIDIYEERSGLLPSTEWKRGAYGQPWYPGETIIAIIGQGYMLATPMQMAEAVTLVANRGKHVQPRLVREDLPDVQRPQWGEDIELKEVDWDAVIKSMENVVSHKRGTAHWRIGRNLPYRMAGKTGTAQVVSIAQGEDYDAEKLKEFQRDHSLFVAFAPIEDPQIALSVIVENDKGAANVAREIMDYYLIPKLKENAEKEGK